MPVNQLLLFRTTARLHVDLLLTASCLCH